MGFLQKLFGGGKREKEYVDKTGLYFYVQCDNCGTAVRVRADKQHDLLSEDGGYVWHKTIVDSKCFRRIPVVVYLDRSYQMTSAEIEGGHFITEEEYNAFVAAANQPVEEPDAAESVDEPTDKPDQSD
ncbi:MAG: hypothetical protein HF973_07635 [Chloroflexi bacterium]|nr:hypothetical protein [Chloroflexota bacterium]